MGMGVSILGKEQESYDGFFEQFDAFIRETLKSLFDRGENPETTKFVCMSCGKTITGIEIKKGACPHCSGREILPKDFAL